MAARAPRRNPQPPNRNRSRRPGVPSVAQIAKDEGLSYSRYKPTTLDASPGPKPVSPVRRSSPAKAKSDRSMSYETALAMQEAREGDDTDLLAYQPTPSINPARPRTLAAGYDPQTKTMRVRFRDGTGYEYYDVSPEEWRNFRRVKSPGRAINRTFNHHDYSPASW